MTDEMYTDKIFVPATDHVEVLGFLDPQETATIKYHGFPHDQYEITFRNKHDFANMDLDISLTLKEPDVQNQT